MLGVKILEEKTSPINGKISVIKSLGLGTYIQVANLTQSGGVVYEVWRNTLKEIKNLKLIIKNCLILGLGGGSAATLVQKYWPEAKITGVDIDPVMVEMGKKYLGLKGVETIIDDAENYLKKINSQGIKYDLILVDLYVGDQVPKQFETNNYIHLVRSGLASGGVAVFNRLYFGEKRRQAVKFGEKLDNLFPKVMRFFPEANLMFICSA
jgi:spermidine synthase